MAGGAQQRIDGVAGVAEFIKQHSLAANNAGSGPVSIRIGTFLYCGTSPNRMM